jgi:hypothetical protein
MVLLDQVVEQLVLEPFFQAMVVEEEVVVMLELLPILLVAMVVAVAEPEEMGAVDLKRAVGVQVEVLVEHLQVLQGELARPFPL